MPTPQARYWLLTVPVYDPNESPTWTKSLPDGVKYIRGQQEVGSSTGYRHWQLLVASTKPVSMSKVKEWFGSTAHCERSRSAAADEYVWKEDTSVPGTRFEVGTKAIKRNSKSDWDRIWQYARDGNFEQIDSQIRVQHYRTLRVIRSDYSRPIGMERTCYVFWGPTGTGKSRTAWEQAGLEAYPKDPRTKWWDGYLNQEHVVIDEFRGAIDPAHLLRWLDRYPVLVEIKGSTVPLKATKIWITSNLSPDAWYPDLDEETKKALRRRLTVTHFDDFNKIMESTRYQAG